MATQAETLVRIEKDGKQKAVTLADFSHRKMAGLDGQTYEEAGYKIVSYEDGTPYEDGQTPGDLAIHTAARTANIGEQGSNATNLDGSKASDDVVAAAGATMADATEPKPRAKATANADASASESPTQAAETA